MKERQPPEEPDPKAFERFKNLTRKVIAAPKKEVDAAMRKAAKARKKRG